MSDRIFISIASYRDPQTIPTIQDCINNADDPSRLIFGIGLQHEYGESNLQSIDAKNSIIKNIEFDWRNSKGVGWIRNLIVKNLISDEEFYLQLDSHHRFVKGWDSLLIKLYNNIKNSISEKPLLSCYAPKFDPDTEHRDSQPLKLNCLSDFANDGDLMFVPKKMKTDNDYVPARFLSGHFIFSSSKFCKECPYDPNIYFRGEELSLSARAYTSGYDMFHPKPIILYHEYSRSNQHKHWDDHTEHNGFIINSKKLADKSKERVRSLLGIDQDIKNLGQYGLGKQRPIHEYELYAGLNFKTKQVHKYAYDENNIYKQPFIMPEDEWLNGLMTQKIVKFTMDKDLIDMCLDATNFECLSIIFNGSDNKQVYRKDVSIVELAHIIQNKYEIKIQASMEDDPIEGFLWTKLSHDAFLPKIKISNLIRIEYE